MNDTDWAERLDALAGREDAHLFDVRDDVARGRSRLLRNRVGVTAAAALVGVVVLGTGLALGAGGPGRATPAPADEGPTAAPTYHEPQTTLSPSAPPAPTPTLSAQNAYLHKQLDGAWKGAGDIPFRTWRYDLYATARSVLDPSGTHLTYSSRGLTSGSDDQGVGLGIKLGWTEPGRSGEGMVEVAVTTEGGSDDERCQMTGGFGCPRAVQVGGETLKVGTGDQGELVVLYRQPDGERAVVLVNPLFGNNSRTPVQQGFVNRRDVYRLVQDDRLGLPRPPSR